MDKNYPLLFGAKGKNNKKADIYKEQMNKSDGNQTLKNISPAGQGISKTASGHFS